MVIMVLFFHYGTYQVTMLRYHFLDHCFKEGGYQTKEISGIPGVADSTVRKEENTAEPRLDHPKKNIQKVCEPPEIFIGH